MLGGSALLHVVVLLALIVTLSREKPPEEPLPPPAVSVIFEGGSKTGPTQPKPAPEAGSQAAPTPAPEQPPAPEAPPVPPPPAPPPEPQEQALVQPEQPPAPVQPPPEPLKPAPPRVQLVLPRPPAATAPFEMPELPPPPPPQPAPARPAPRRPRPVPRSEFTPMVRNWSLGQQRAPAAPRGYGPTMAGPESAAASQLRGAEQLGTDWRNALSAWVEAHKYYPDAARINGEDGSPEVEVVVRRDGRVQSVELEERSGSAWLDMALQALFRGAMLPRFPDDAKEDEITFHFTMHYILIRR